MIALNAARLAECLTAMGLAILIGALFAFPILALLRALRSRQEVSTFAPEGHQTKQGTPTMGGLIILASLALTVALIPALFPRNAEGVLTGWNFRFYEGDPKDPEAPRMWAWFAVVGAFALIGFIDDFLVPRLFAGKRGLGWIPKLVMQFSAASLVPSAIGWDFNWGSYGVAALVVLFFANAYNFSDGLDGLAGSLGLILFTTIGIFCLLVHSGEPTVWAFSAAGATIPFLFANAPPAKVFMGDVGSLPLGALLGLFLLILMTPVINLWGVEYRYGEFSFMISGGMPGGDFFPRLDAWRSIPALAILSFVMIAELVPVPLQILSVKVFKRKLFPFTPIHHAFEKRGWPESRVVWTFALTQLVLAVIALVILLPAIDTDMSASTKGKPRMLGP